jgi:YjbE family integral membrane protein
MLLHWLGLVVAIIVVDLALSGDNALVIGAAASRLSGRRRSQAIVLGGIIAIALRIGLAIAAVYLLNVPFIKAAGGILVFLIAIQLVHNVAHAPRELEEAERPNRGWRQHLGGTTLLGVALTITLADISMSLDNVLAVAALANGNLIVLVCGLLLSILLLLVASAVIAVIIARFPILLYAAGAILAWTGGAMVYGDTRVFPILDGIDQQVPGPSFAVLVPLLLVILLFLFSAAFAVLRRLSLNKLVH